MERDVIPILKWGNYLITSPQTALHDKMALRFGEAILKKIVETNAKGLILDISAIDIVDSFLVRKIAEIATSTKIMGAQVIVVGLRPAVAMTLSEMGFTLNGIYTALDLEKGIAILEKMETH